MTANASSNLTPPWLPSSLSSSASAQQMTTTTGSWWTVGGEGGGGGGGNGSHLSPMSSPLVTSLYGILSPSSNGGSTLPLNSIAASLSAASSTLSMGTEGAVSSTVPTTTSTLAADDLITTLTTLVSGDPNCTVSSIISTASMSPDYEQEQQDHNIYIMPLFTQIIWSFIFGSMIFVAAGGNIIVIWIVLTHKRMRTVTNYFLVNLSLADTMVALLNVLENFIYMLNGDWPFGEVYCKVSNFVAILSVAASVFTLMAISIDRYLAIVHPLRPRMSRTMTLNIIVCIWICSSLLSLPNIIYSTTLLESFRNGDSRVICYLEWYDGPSTKSRMEYIYNILILLVTYMLPIVSMSYTYFRVGKELWGSQSIGECTAKQMESIKSKRKIVKMMMIVVAIFGICWFPYHVYFLLAHHYPSIVSSEYAQHTYLSIYWLAMSNSMYNPFVYCWMNSRFRQGFKNIFCCTCLRQKDQNMFDKPRYHGAARYSCASEACTTDMRVRFNGNGNITLQATSATDAPGTTGSSATSPLQSKFTFSREML